MAQRISYILRSMAMGCAAGLLLSVVSSPDWLTLPWWIWPVDGALVNLSLGALAVSFIGR